MKQEVTDFITGLYPTYTQYKSEERLTAVQFDNYGVDVIYFLEALTGGKTTAAIVNQKHLTELGFAIINIADIDFDYDNRKRLMATSDVEVLARGVKSESVKSHSKTYETTVADTLAQWEKETHRQKVDMAKKYLLTTGLLYRGL